MTVTDETGEGADPRARVEALQRAHRAAHARVAPLFDRDRDGNRPPLDAGFDAWRAELSRLDALYCEGDVLVAGGSEFSSPSALDPDVVATGEVEVHGSSARVSLVPLTSRGGHKEVNLVRTGGEWRITSIATFHGDPASPIVTEQVRREHLEQARSAQGLHELGENDNPAIGDLFLTGYARVPRDDEDDDEYDEETAPADHTDAEVVATELRDLGSFPHGDLLAVGDAGYIDHMVYVCAMPVEPGHARAQALLAHFTASTRVAAVRAVLSSAPAVTWKQALSVPGSGYAVGVDSGSAAILDAAAYLGQTYRQWHHGWDSWLEHDAALFDAGAGPIGVITRSGWGDGTYGVYWGLDQDERPVQLVIDYGVLAAPAEAPVEARADGAAGEPAEVSADAGQDAVGYLRPLHRLPEVPEHLAADYSAGFVSAVRRALARPLRFRGIASRREFWFAYLAWVGISIVVMTALGLLADWVATRVEDPAWPTTAIGLSGITVLAVVALIYLLPLTVRRLHDGGRSGWWILIALVPSPGGIILIVLLALEPRPWLWRPQWIGAARGQ
ncbi:MULTISPECIES: DUF805 domain-containing protein [Actinomyces]|uniref:DUF805 domain-containing protein n=1 Tax=Actinomyces respiraculi TaxID=2744574 RepID=A0A7T0LK92_9ACTO|nr:MULTISPECIES: DUF805 domain-containing protein [Actinomyces]QPL05339.1 DUF805 domain-containing protein [Actinomyces respiraculi]